MVHISQDYEAKTVCKINNIAIAVQLVNLFSCKQAIIKDIIVENPRRHFKQRNGPS